MTSPPRLAGPPPTDLPRLLTTMSRHLGDVLAIENPAGTPTAFCVGPAAIGELFARERDGELVVHNTATVHTLFRRAVFTLTGREHAEARTYLANGLRREAVAAYLPSVARVARGHVSGWTHSPGVSLYEAAREYTMDVCLSAILGLAADDIVARRIPALFDRFVAGAELPPGCEATQVFVDAVDAATELRYLLRRCVRRVSRLDRPSVVSALAASNTTTDGDVTDHLLALLIAARETTASLITWLLIELALDDQLAATLAPEARAVAGDPMLALSRGGAVHMRAVLAECTRMHTPNTMATRRAVSEVRIGGYRIPPGWHVAYSAPATHRLPQLFANPKLFDPQRFCGTSGARAAAGLLAFGRGAHACAGRALAEATTILLAAAVLAEHRIELAAPAGRPAVGRFAPVRTPAEPTHAHVRMVSP